MEAKLISVVKKYPELYDREHSNYQQLKVSKALWDEVGREMCLPGDECQTVWKRLKKSYLENLKRQYYGEFGSFEYEDKMEFLWPFYEDSFTQGDYPECSDKEDDDDDDVVIICEDDSQTGSTSEVRDSDDSLSDNDLDFSEGETSESHFSQSKDQAKGIKPVRRDPSDIQAKYKHIDIKKMISMVEKEPFLYDIRRPDFYNFPGKKTALWKRIARLLRCSSTEIRKCWASLKKVYIEELAREVGSHVYSYWKFKHEMAFLKPIYLPKQTSLEQERSVVLAVKKHPVIYDTRYIEHNNGRALKQYWERVAEESHCSLEECKRIWQNLYTCYRQLIKLHHSGLHSSSWRLKEEMSFLEPILESEQNALKQAESNEPLTEADKLKYKIIDCVKKFPILYDIKHPEFTSIRCKNMHIWQSIGKDVNLPAEDARNVWNDLRKSYISYEKRKLAGSNVSPWKFADAMSFYDLLIGQNGKIARKYDMKRGELIYRDDKRDFERQLIESVKRCPQLYDYTREDYVVTTDITQRKHLWSVIGKKLNATGQECSTTWRNLKKFYVNSIQRPVPGESPLGRKWKFKDEMEFLLPLYKNKKAYSRVRMEDTDDFSMTAFCAEYMSDEASSSVIIKHEVFDSAMDDPDSFARKFIQNNSEYGSYEDVYIKSETDSYENPFGNDMLEDENVRSVKKEPSSSDYDPIAHGSNLFYIKSVSSESSLD